MLKRYRSFGIVILVFLVCAFLSCSKIDDESSTDSNTEIAYNITGRVFDDSGAPIAEALVAYDYGYGQGETSTDVNGIYHLYDVNTGVYTIAVSKSGYTVGQTKAEVSGDVSIVADVILKNSLIVENRVERTITVGEIWESGIALEKEIELDVSMGGDAMETLTQNISVSIAPETDIFIDGKRATGSIDLTITPVEGNEAPLSSDVLSLGTVLLEPANAEFSKAVHIKLPVTIKMQSGVELPLRKYESGGWRDVGFATVDETGLSADAEITEFGKFSIQFNYSFETSIIDYEEKEIVTFEIPENQNIIEIEANDTVEFPEGLPEGITKEYAISLIEKIESTQFNVNKKMLIELPEVTGVVAKATSPLSTYKKPIKEKKQPCTVTVKVKGSKKEVTWYGNSPDDFIDPITLEPIDWEWPFDFKGKIVYKEEKTKIEYKCKKQKHDQGIIGE